MTRQSPFARALRRFTRHRLAMLGFATFALVLLVIVLGPFVLRSPNAIDLVALNRPPGAGRLLGTDGVGRDVLARLVEGGRVSLLVASCSVAIALVLGFLAGAIAAFGGRVADSVAMRLVDITMTLPPVILLLVLASITGPGIGWTILVIALLSWPTLARTVRARLLEVRERDFVIAARGLGATTAHIIRRHALPNCADILIVTATIQVANAVLLEAGLSFLGLGVPPPDASWGNMLNTARSLVVLENYPWQWMFPGLALVVTVLAVNFAGDGLRDALDPRSEIG
jgi:peptide/nickel transport system permease protein